MAVSIAAGVFSGPLTRRPYAFSHAAMRCTFPHKGVSAEPTVRAGDIQEHLLTYSASPVPAILLVLEQS